MKNVKELISVYLMTIFCSIATVCALYIQSSYHITVYGFITVFMTAATLGFLLCTVISLIPSRPWRKALAIILSSIQGIITLTAFFVSDYYKAFMPPSDILSGAGGVVKQFWKEALREIASGWWMIFICVVPILLFTLISKFVFHGTEHNNLKFFRILWSVCLAVSLTVSSLLIVFSVDLPVLTDNFDFDTSVRTYGLPVSVGADLYHRISGGNSTFSENENEEVNSEADEPTPKEKVYGNNKLDIDLAALSANEKNNSVKNAYSYISGVPASTQNEYTGIFKNKNLIFITAEAFSGEVIDRDLTPTLYRLANCGIKFTDYYQPSWGGSTSTGEYSNIVGLVPTKGVDSLKVAQNNNMYFTLGNQFQRLGYYTAAYHDNLYNYYDRHLTHKNLGYTDYMGYGNGMEKGIHYTWPESDLEMFDYTVGLYADKQPFCIYYMTVSGHGGYRTSGNYMSRKNYSVVENLDKSEEVKCYLAAQYELELALSSLIDSLSEKGILDNTVIVLASDHYPYSLSDLSELYGYTADTCVKRDHSALIIWTPSIEDKHIRVSTPTYSLDILPTLSNLFGLPYDSRMLIGRDVFSEQTPLVIWTNKSWKTDKGFYDSTTKTFTPTPGVAHTENYVDEINKIVGDKITYSSICLEYDLFGKIFGPDNIK